MDIDISIEDYTLLSGRYGIVWASWKQRQAEAICNALLAGNISSPVGNNQLKTAHCC